MRISDWSSDVCSSDLQPHSQHGAERDEQDHHGSEHPERLAAELLLRSDDHGIATEIDGGAGDVELVGGRHDLVARFSEVGVAAVGEVDLCERDGPVGLSAADLALAAGFVGADDGDVVDPSLDFGQQRLEAGADRWVVDRSEEHTAELQSLMRISYAVFCLKKKT